MPLDKLRFFIDRGGTFTDIVALTGDGRLIVDKVLSHGHLYKKDPAIIAIEKIIAQEKKGAIGTSADIVSGEIRLGTTVATNALLEREGQATALITNKGLGDSLIIGYQNRPDIFALNIDRPPPLFKTVVELDCRFGVAGEIKSFDGTEAEPALQALINQGIKSIAVVFMHSYKYPQHEIACAELAQKLGFEQIFLSHKSSGLIRFVSRGDTTLVDAYLTPPLKRYIDQVQKDLTALQDTDKSASAIPLLFMKSDGGLASASAFSGNDAILSGPAGGVVGAVAVAKQHTIPEDQKELSVVAFDMGGTSTDVSYYQGSFDKEMESTIAGVRLRTPMLAVHTVAAGGGSILAFDGARFRVGPESAKAQPGPACYGLGGPATITDANLILGRLCSDDFPALFGLNGDAPLNAQAAASRIKEIAARLKGNQTIEEIAAGFLKIATEKMAQAITQVSIQKGHDVRLATMVAFGGAGGQHACAIADRLEIKKILLSPLAGVLSAYGIGASDRNDIQQKTIRKPLSHETLASLQKTLPALQSGSAVLFTDLDLQMSTKEQLALSYAGSDTAILIDYEEKIDDCLSLRQKFIEAHRKLFGFAFESNQIIVESVLVETTGKNKESLDRLQRSAFTSAQAEAKSAAAMPPPRPWRMFCQGKMTQASLFRRQDLRAGAIVFGPALITENISTTVIEPGWEGLVLEDNCLLLQRRQDNAGGEKRSNDKKIALTEADPVQLELFNNIFMSIAEEMGITLQKVSHSVNIKERLDFSCAIFDADGRLIANAPHIPVHLGSMGDSVVSLIKATGNKFNPGDAFVLNNPYNGGTHLPDMTVISPIFEASSAKSEDSTKSGQKPLFFVGSRGHHADIGGITPGSMPPLSRHINDEGVLFDNVKILSQGVFLQDEFCRLLTGAMHPARNIEQNIKDIKAQIAANVRGGEALHKTIERWGLDVVNAYMQFVRQNAAQSIVKILKSLSGGSAACNMDDGSVIAVKITVDNKIGRATIDFTGTSEQSSNNFNTPLAVTRAAVLYVFRTLTQDAIPLNDGCSEPLTLIVPQGCLLNPTYPGAVVAGNVETSQVIVDTLYQALGKLAGSQGTMNNFTFGDSRHQYYETICGGAGAGDGFDGADAIQTHMTNSRLTDPEILEERFPVIVEEFAIRKGSGGSGKYTGGNGARRKIRFVETMTASILSNRRITRSPGLNGGGDGASGANFLVHSDGTTRPLPYTATLEVMAGQAILIETPGGGGYGKAAD